jgi:hypothetical protein
MTYTHLGEMFELLPIYAAAVFLGLVSGVTAVHVVTARRSQRSLRTLMGIVALAAFLAGLVAAKPSFWVPTVELWGLATGVMAVVDLSASCLVEPWREARRFSDRSHRLRIGLPAGIVGALAGVLAVLKLQFDIPLNTNRLPSFAAGLAVTLVGLAALDLAARLTAMGLRRRKWMRRGTERTTKRPVRQRCPGPP